VPTTRSELGAATGSVGDLGPGVPPEAATLEAASVPGGQPGTGGQPGAPAVGLPGGLGSSHGLCLRLATWVHWATLAGAFGFWAVLDRHLWFFGDEWQFLTARGLWHWPGNRHGIWFPHNEHWSTLPVVLWRGLYNVFHLGSYWPYLVPLLVAQVGVMHLAWRLCRREGTGPWVATAAVSVLGFLGAGAEDLAWAFQVGFVGSVLFGLLAVDLLERASPARSPAGPAPAATRYDGLASVSLLASLMCSTVGDAMVAGAAVVLFARRPWRQAARTLALPVGSYVVWFAFIGRLGLRSPADHLTMSTLTGLPSYVWTGLSSALGAAFNLQAAGPALLVGLATWVAWRAQHLWRAHPALLGLSAASVAFYVLVALGRDALGGSQAVGRYTYVAIAILTPVIAWVLGQAGGVAASISSRGTGRGLAPQAAGAWAPRAVVVGLLAVTALGGAGQAGTYLASRQQLVDGLKVDTEALARLVASGTQDVAGPSAQPLRFEPNLTPTVLARLQRARLLPRARLSPLDMVNARTLLSVALTRRPLSRGHFRLLGSSYASVLGTGPHCQGFSPVSASQPVQIWLQPVAPAGLASVLLDAPPAPAGTTDYLAALIVPRGGPAATQPAELAMPASGTSYLSYDDADAKLVLLWDAGTTLTLCGLQGPGRSLAAHPFTSHGPSRPPLPAGGTALASNRLAQRTRASSIISPPAPTTTPLPDASAAS